MKRYAILGSLDIGSVDGDARTFALSHATDATMSLKEITKRAVREIEKDAIGKALLATNWNRKEAAKRLRISYRALIYKIQEAGLTENRRQKRASAS